MLVENAGDCTCISLLVHFSRTVFKKKIFLSVSLVTTEWALQNEDMASKCKVDAKYIE
jgi:hypothetical protein